MTIPNVVSGADIATSWGNAVADQLNDLPLAIQHGVEGATTSSTGQLTVTFPAAFANSSYTVVATCVEANSQIQTTAQVQNRNTTDVTFRILSDDVRDDSVARTVHWVAIGELA